MTKSSDAALGRSTAHSKISVIKERLRQFKSGPYSDFPKHLEDEFRQSYNEVSAPIASTGLGIGVALFLIFYLWDMLVDYSHSGKTLVVRLVVAACLITIIVLPKKVRAQYCQPLFTFGITIGGVGIVWIISFIDNGLIIGVGGVMIALMYNFGFLRLLFLPSLTSGLAICAAYNIAAAIGGLDPLILIANNFFLLTAMITGGSVTYLLEKLFRQQFLSERKLVKEREMLAWQSQNDARYLSWLRELARFLRHEVRSPIAQINSSIEIAQLTGKEDERITPYLKSAALGSQHVWNLIERASLATDAEAFVRQFNASWTDLGQLLGEQLDAFRQSSSGVEFRLQHDAPVRLFLDATLIKEAIGNLLSNAVSFADEDSAIEVALSSDDTHALIEVSNRGPLIGDAESLFQPFVSTRSGPSEEHQGLGLYLVRLIAEQHGGTAAIANRDNGSGVVASIRLPLAPNYRIPSDNPEHAQI